MSNPAKAALRSLQRWLKPFSLPHATPLEQVITLGLVFLGLLLRVGE